MTLIRWRCQPIRNPSLKTHLSFFFSLINFKFINQKVNCSFFMLFFHFLHCLWFLNRISLNLSANQMSGCKARANQRPTYLSRSIPSILKNKNIWLGKCFRNSLKEFLFSLHNSRFGIRLIIGFSMPFSDWLSNHKLVGKNYLKTHPRVQRHRHSDNICLSRGQGQGSRQHQVNPKFELRHSIIDIGLGAREL